MATWNWSQCSFTILKILGSLRIMLTLSYLYFRNGTRKPGWLNICLHRLLNILSLLLGPTAQKKKKIPSKILLLLDHVPGYLRAVMEINMNFRLFSCLLTQYAFCIPWMEEPGGLQPMGSQRVGHDWATSLSLSTFMHWRGKWQPTPVFLPGESQGLGSLVGCRLRGRTESDTTEAT